MPCLGHRQLHLDLSLGLDYKLCILLQEKVFTVLCHGLLWYLVKYMESFSEYCFYKYIEYTALQMRPTKITFSRY